jgi:hypothetical protein
LFFFQVFYAGYTRVFRRAMANFSLFTVASGAIPRAGSLVALKGSPSREIHGLRGGQVALTAWGDH